MVDTSFLEPLTAKLSKFYSHVCPPFKTFYCVDVWQALETRAIKSKQDPCVLGAYSLLGEADINQQVNVSLQTAVNVIKERTSFCKS